MPIATASPWRSRWPVICSSLWAAQCPKSSGREDPSSNGSPPVAMCARWSLAERRTSRSMASRVPRREQRSVALEEIEERRIPHERNLDCLGNPGPPVALREGREEREVVDHGERRGEGPEIVLLAECVDAVLDADCGIVLREHGRRHSNQPDAAMGRRRGVPDDVENRPAADRRHVRVAAQARGVYGLQGPARARAGCSLPPRRP